MIVVVMLCAVAHGQPPIDVDAAMSDQPQSEQVVPPPAPTNDIQPTQQPVAGPQWPQGEVGPVGPPGSAGASGQNGQDGRNGHNGRPGRDAELPKDWLRQSPRSWSGDSTKVLKGDATGLHAGRPMTREEGAAVVQREGAKVETAANRYTDKQVGTERDQRIAADAKKRKDKRDMIQGVIGAIFGVVVALLVAYLIWGRRPRQAGPNEDYVGQLGTERDALGEPDPGNAVFGSLVRQRTSRYQRDESGRICAISRRVVEPAFGWINAGGGVTSEGGNALAIVVNGTPAADGEEAGTPPFPPSEEKAKLKPPPPKKAEPEEAKVGVPVEPELKPRPSPVPEAPFVRTQGNVGQIALRLPRERRDQTILVAHRPAGSNIEPTVFETETKSREAVVPVDSGQHEVRICRKSDGAWSSPRIVRVPNGTKVDPAKTPLGKAVNAGLEEVLDEALPAAADAEPPPPCEEKPTEAKEEPAA